MKDEELQVFIDKFFTQCNRSVNERDSLGNTLLLADLRQKGRSYYASVDVHLRNGADVNAYRQQPGKVVREPLLHLAVRYQGAAELTRLLELGADPTLTDEHGRTSLALARELKRYDLIPLLETAEN